MSRAGSRRQRREGMARALQSTLKKLSESVERGEYYEAHQMYRTVYFRYYGQEKYGDALQTLSEGARLLLNKGQYSSGCDLALTIVEVYSNTHTEVNDESRERITSIYPLIPATESLRERFVTRALAWTVDEGTNTRGDPQLHHLFGMQYYKEKSYVEAISHLIYGTDVSARALGDVLVQCALESAGDDRHVDSVIAQPLLKLISLQDLQSANTAFSRVISKHPEIGDFPRISYPLVDLVQCLLVLCQHEAGPVFQALKNSYIPVLQDNPTCAKYVNRIGESYYRIQAQRSGGIFGDLMNQMMA
ncbi:hypothetical protein SARC_04114 [Sphaeroforma arctica JP610]|uniref:Uncharacterized protein n=1 Tax=Sphaeroforma arctica JP610 TaxID=667725 RepID=A0A0L0G614_9EUKA|nr:hypothetical protein, variant [Sphaeroforma arctica JP610]XP_014157556.1 hypothetical protein SARC_04114 [Sphaeroforma arctica JP610]KNC83653.1 hypothetical protein, variant [Sphaeroforma arctica JP610]KNC83654.1 hypothetical protein SARC_04114 [Sphaeroforma arctica JP610]|eukprot:XP_014157555.1 hypothetical protein, variant [Sphaeroforma arctica JP610]